MDFASTLIRDLSDVDAFEAWQEQRRAAPLENRELRAVALLRGELLNIAPSIVITTSLVNQASAIEAEPLAVDYCEHGLGLAGFALRSIEASPACFEAMQYWHNVEARLAFAIGLARQARRLTDCAPIADVLPDAWQRVCTATIQCVGAFSDLMTMSGVSRARGDEAALLDLLRRAGAGEWPCFDSAGGMQVPGWAERRSETRLPCEREVRIEIDGATERARLLNVSIMGASLMSRHDLRRGQLITLFHDDGTALLATVIWSHRSRVGLKFRSRLTAAQLTSFQTSPVDGPAPASA